MFKGQHKASSNSTIQITIWISKSFSSNLNVVTHGGNNLNKLEDAENEDVDLFTITAAESSTNGTSINSGQIPAILYYLY